VRLHVDRDIEAAGRPTARACLAFAGQADLVSLVDAGGDRHLERAAAFRSAVTVAVSQGDSTILPSPRQRGQALTLTIWPSIVWRTVRTSRDRCTGDRSPPRSLDWRRCHGRFAALEHANSICFSVPRTASSK